VRVYYKPRLWLEFWNLRWWCNKMLTQQSRQLLKGFMSMPVEWLRLNNVPQWWTKTKGNRFDVLHDLLFNSRRKKEETTYFSSLLRFCSMVGMISTKKLALKCVSSEPFTFQLQMKVFFLILISDWVKLNKLSDKDLEKSHLLYIYIYINCEKKSTLYINITKKLLAKQPCGILTIQRFLFKIKDHTLTIM
jgi:hypothetical protein